MDVITYRSLDYSYPVSAKGAPILQSYRSMVTGIGINSPGA